MVYTQLGACCVICCWKTLRTMIVILGSCVSLGVCLLYVCVCLCECVSQTWSKPLKSTRKNKEKVLTHKHNVVYEWIDHTWATQSIVLQCERAARQQHRRRRHHRRDSFTGLEQIIYAPVVRSKCIELYTTFRMLLTNAEWDGWYMRYH